MLAATDSTRQVCPSYVMLGWVVLGKLTLFLFSPKPSRMHTTQGFPVLRTWKQNEKKEKAKQSTTNEQETKKSGSVCCSSFSGGGGCLASSVFFKDNPARHPHLCLRFVSFRILTGCFFKVKSCCVSAMALLSLLRFAFGKRELLSSFTAAALEIAPSMLYALSQKSVSAALSSLPKRQSKVPRERIKPKPGK